MKYLIITLILLFNCSISSAQDMTDEAKTYADPAEHSFTISANFTGISRYYTGLNCLFQLPGIDSESGRYNYFINVSGGFYKRGIVKSVLNFKPFKGARGSYIDLGMRMEIESARNQKNRFHVGLNAGHKWLIEIDYNSLGPTERKITEIVIQVPIGYTYRSPTGFYLSTGLEVTTEKLFPALDIHLGFAF